VRGPEAAAYQELLGFLLQEGSLQPERCLSYEIGIEHLSEDNYLVSLTAYYDQVQHYLISLYLPGEHKALSSNVGEAIVQGIQLALTKSFLKSCQASLSYRWQQAVGDELRQASKMLQEIEGATEALGFELSHEISTALETLIKPTDTTVEAIYRLNMAPLEEGNSLGSGEMGFSSRLDVKVRQLLPQLAGTSRWEVYLWLKNLLNQQQINFFNLREDELFNIPRVFVSGVCITF
jgi:outer membrane receptor protein involved in Fe transport